MNKPMRIVRIVEGTSVDGPGLRTSIYFAGCRHHCPECHNPQTWDFLAGRDMDISEVLTTVLYNDAPVTFSGGDPIYQAEAILPLARAIREAGLGIWCYTGFTFEQLKNGIDDVPATVLTLLFRGSTNQRLIDMRRTLASGEIVEFTPESVW